MGPPVDAVDGLGNLNVQHLLSLVSTASIERCIDQYDPPFCGRCVPDLCVVRDLDDVFRCDRSE